MIREINIPSRMKTSQCSTISNFSNQFFRTIRSIMNALNLLTKAFSSMTMKASPTVSKLRRMICSCLFDQTIRSISTSRGCIRRCAMKRQIFQLRLAAKVTRVARNANKAAARELERVNVAPWMRPRPWSIQKPVCNAVDPASRMMNRVLLCVANPTW